MNFRVLHMLEQAGFKFTPDVMHKLPLFEKLVGLEREACAKLCDEHKNPIDDPLAPVGTYESGKYVVAEFLADAIRARGQE